MGEATCQRSVHEGPLRLPLELIEIALQDLERREHEEREPQVQDKLAAFSARLRSLSSKDARATSTQQDCLALRELHTMSPRRQPCSHPKQAKISDDEGPNPVSPQKVEVNEESTVALANTTAFFSFSSITERRNAGQLDLKRSSSRLDQTTKRKDVKGFSQLFYHLDLDGNGSVGMAELSLGLKGMGLRDQEVQKFMSVADTSGDGMIHREEFLRALESPSLRDMVANGDLDFEVKKHPCMLRQSSTVRVFWDLVCACALSYLAILEPLFLAFPGTGESVMFQWISFIVDGVFLSDVLLNFRTGFSTVDGFEVLEPWAVAKNYLKTWFVLDLVSSLPLEAMTADSITNLQPLRLLKYWKVVKVLKALKLSRSLTAAFDTDFAVDAFDRLRHSVFFKIMPLMFILFVMMLTCHWLACFMLVSGDGFLGGYLEPQAAASSVKRQLSEYLAGFYWAFTTVSTVGYGDITPGSDLERLYSILAMSIGGAVYGYFIAKFTSIITRSELGEQVYEAKMDEVYDWLHHHQFPRDLRRRTRRYFERYFRQKARVDDQCMLDSLSPDLRSELSEYIVVSEVRNLQLFADVPAGVISRLAKILVHVEVQKSEQIVQRGEVGSAVYVITSGAVKLEFGDKGTDHAHARSSDTQMLENGDSFGEELLLVPGSHYSYTATAETSVTMKAIQVAAFHIEFHGFPRVVEQVMLNAASFKGACCKNVKPLKPFEMEARELLREIRDFKDSLAIGTGEGQMYLVNVPEHGDRSKMKL